MPLFWRPDGDVVRDVPATRRIMPFIMRTRTESAVYFEQNIDISKTMEFLQEIRESSGRHVTLLHLFIWAVGQILVERPRLNRFTAGGRIYQRRGIWVSFSAKKGKTDDHPIVVIKRPVDPKLDLLALIDDLHSSIDEGRSDKKSTTDKELALFLALPTFLLSWMVSLVMKLDQWGCLPGFFIKDDPMFASVFIANLGSLQMDAGFHHLFEYGNIPIFATIGRSRVERSLAKDGSIVEKTVLTVRYSFDERVEDGLYCLRALKLLEEILEDPAAALERAKQGL